MTSDKSVAPHILLDGPGAPPSHASARYRSLLERLYALATGGTTLGLGPIGRVLADLGHPELSFKSVHIAGSNGKGSASAFLASILSAHGHRVGLYTSPHLISLTERIQFLDRSGVRPIAPDALIEAIELVESVAPGYADLSFFEVMTAAGLVALRDARVDVGVIEAGLGARLDATRLVDASVAILTDLALEHTEILGDTLEEIAREKSYVARPGRPLVAADGPPGAMRVVEEMSATIGAELLRIGRDIFVRSNGDGTFDFHLGDRALERVRLSLLGPHQGRNALLATKGALLTDPSLTEASIRRGLEGALWPGRMEIFEARRRGARILLDGAHNPHGAEVLARALTEHRALFSGPLHFVFGVLGDKDAKLMLEALTPIATSLTLTRPSSPRARPPSDLVPWLPSDYAGRVEVIEGVEIALASAEARAARDLGWVVVCGSLYLVGDVRACLIT